MMKKPVADFGQDEDQYYEDIVDRRFSIYEMIEPIGEGDNSSCGKKPLIPWIIEQIMQCNREDKECKNNYDKKPIRLYINCPGGDLAMGFALIDAIQASSTPVYTINIGEWSSVALLIGMAGDKRFSLPHARFLLHDGESSTGNSAAKARDEAEFNKRFEDEVVRTHVLECSKMTPEEYDKIYRIEYYMLPKDALEKGFIDEIVTDLEKIL